jgi:hypothetical protein
MAPVFVAPTFRQRLVGYPNRARELIEFDGCTSLWRPACAVLAVVGLFAMPVVGGLASIYVGGNGANVPRTILGVCVAVILTSIGSKMMWREPWRLPMDSRLNAFSMYEPGGQFMVPAHRCSSPRGGR